MRRARFQLLPELALVVLGALLRFTFLDNHGDASRNFDFLDHKLYLEWFEKNWALPPLSLSRSSYGPPLYYFLGGLGLRLGGGMALVHWASVAMGVLRLSLFAWALKWALPDDRLARCYALAVAAVLPAAVHLDGMTNNESLSLLLCWSLLASWRWVHEAEGRKRWEAGGIAGVLLGAALLTKYSAIILAPSMAGIALCSWVFGRAQPMQVRLQQSGPWILAIVLATLLSGGYFARNYAEHGRLFPTAFEGNDRVAMTEEIRTTPIWNRRETGFFLGWSKDIYQVPHYPSGTTPESHFFPTLLASTFSAYYLVNFSRQQVRADPATNARLPEPTLSLARMSVIGGTWLALTLVLGLLVLLMRAYRSGNALELAYLVTPVLAVFGQAYFSLQYPIDTYGVTKGGYLQFAAPCMFAVSGLVTSWTWRRPAWRPLAVFQFIALGYVAVYTIYSRLTAV